MTARKYSDPQICEFYKKYCSFKTWSVTKFANEYNLSFHSLLKGFKRLNFKIVPLSISKRKFQINEDFFEVIDSEEKAYSLGFAFADGCNTGKRLEISLAKKDKDILDKISKLLLFGKINVHEYKSKKINSQNKVGLYVVSKKMCDDLKKLGCVPRKTFTLKFPSLNKNIIRHFVRGFFDGDGMLTFYTRHKNRKPEAQFSITSTKEMLESIGSCFSELGVNWKIHKRHKTRINNNFTLRVHGNLQIKTVCDFLFKNAKIFLNRKFQAYQKLLELTNVKR